MKVLFNSIIRTMYSGCYYKKGSRVIYLYDIKLTVKRLSFSNANIFLAQKK